MSCPASESAVKTVFQNYEKAYKEDNFDELIKFYHPEAVVVHRGSKCFYGKDAIMKMFKEFSKKAGKCQHKQCNDKFTGMGDWVVVSCDCEMNSDKLGKLKGCFVQMWRKENDQWTIFHDEYTTKEGHFAGC